MKKNRIADDINAFAERIAARMTQYELDRFLPEDWRRTVRLMAFDHWGKVDTNVVMGALSDKVDARYWKERPDK